MHGNEHAGVKALEKVFDLLRAKSGFDSAFTFRGSLLGLIGNLKAYREGKRYIHKDINRSWFPEYIQQLKAGNIHFPEDEEKLHLLEIIEKEIATGQYSKMVLLDLHTTSSEGGIFSICTEDPVSIRLAKALHAPVVTGLLKGISGTTLHYFTTENMGIDTHAIAFEAGHHNDPQSVDLSIAAIINCMRSIEAIQEDFPENSFDSLLKSYSQSLPPLVKVLDKYNVKDASQWKMRPGYRHFQPVYAEEVLAFDHGAPVKAPRSGLILMPLYQNQGSDGFFIVQPCNELTVD